MMENDNLALWYSMRAKILFKEAEKYYEQFRYPMSIFSSQESIEFSLKSIMRLCNVSFKETHEISRSLNSLANQLKGEFREEIKKAAEISATWLGEYRNLVRYGIPVSGNIGILPEEFEMFDKGGAKTALNRTFNVDRWKECLSNGKKYMIDEIMASKIDNRYRLIINPFGEIYPEIDLEKKAVYRSIKEYIYHGGIVTTHPLRIYCG